MILGIGDSSRNDGIVDWSMARSMGCEFGLTRAASTGAWKNGKPQMTRDETLGPNAEGMWANGIKRLTYAWFDPRVNYNSVIAQADNYLEAIRNIGAGELGPVLDLEQTPTIRAYVGIWDHIYTWLIYVKQETGMKPRLYTNADFCNTAGLYAEPGVKEFELIVASWGTTPMGATAPYVPQPWYPGGWRAWQYTNKAVGKPYGFGKRPVCLAVWQE